jgi:hypothetical protein
LRKVGRHAFSNVLIRPTLPIQKCYLY